MRCSPARMSPGGPIMRWVRLLLCASCLVSASQAHSAIEAALVVSPGRIPDTGPQSITYPGQSAIGVRLQGVQPGRNYNLRALVLDANQQTVAELRWWITARAASERTWFELFPSARSEPGTWRIVLELD